MYTTDSFITYCSGESDYLLERAKGNGGGNVVHSNQSRFAQFESGMQVFQMAPFGLPHITYEQNRTQLQLQINTIPRKSILFDIGNSWRSEGVTIFVDRGIVVIARGHTFHSSTLEVSASMILFTPPQHRYSCVLITRGG